MNLFNRFIFNWWLPRTFCEKQQFHFFSKWWNWVGQYLLGWLTVNKIIQISIKFGLLSYFLSCNCPMVSAVSSKLLPISPICLFGPEEKEENLSGKSKHAFDIVFVTHNLRTDWFHRTVTDCTARSDGHLVEWTDIRLTQMSQLGDDQKHSGRKCYDCWKGRWWRVKTCALRTRPSSGQRTRTY